MANLQTIQSSIAPELKKLNDIILRQLGSDNPMMESIISSFLSRKGKQIRPIIVILTAKMMCGNVAESSLAAAAAVELLHNASLIHDDVVDNSKLRRGIPTINAIWDNHIAVLVGDFFVSSSMQQAISTADIRVIDAICHLGKTLSLGELDQIYNARFHSITEEAYLRIIDYKTASLFVACAKVGCYTAGADEKSLALMTEFAKLLGLCFQIRDDIFDYFDDPSIGKPTGNDLREGKITLPLIFALSEKNSDSEKGQMKALAAKEELSDADISALTSYAVACGGIEYAYDKMRLFRAQAAEILYKFPKSDASESLMDIFDCIIERKN
ncbi:MAG: polyprenyl synthetase family protein [Clostridium sp.]|nr:polyprenyl synthetase family protein [Clostridium sp.]